MNACIVMWSSGGRSSNVSFVLWMLCLSKPRPERTSTHSSSFSEVMSWPAIPRTWLLAEARTSAHSGNRFCTFLNRSHMMTAVVWSSSKSYKVSRLSSSSGTNTVASESKESAVAYEVFDTARYPPR